MKERTRQNRMMVMEWQERLEWYDAAGYHVVLIPRQASGKKYNEKYYQAVCRGQVYKKPSND